MRGKCGQDGKENINVNVNKIEMKNKENVGKTETKIKGDVGLSHSCIPSILNIPRLVTIFEL